MNESTDQPTAGNTSCGAQVPWRPFVESLRVFIARRVPTADVEDVLQEALVRLHEAAPSLRDTRRAKSWAFSIARRTIADFYRRRERNPMKETANSAADMADGGTPVKEHLAAYSGEHDVHEEVLSWLRAMADGLPKPYRRALIMADFEGRTQQEVANELGLSVSGAKSRVQRARAKLGDLLKRCCEIEFGPDGRAIDFHRLEGGDEGCS